MSLPENESSIDYVNEMLDVMKGKKFQNRAPALKWLQTESFNSDFSEK